MTIEDFLSLLPVCGSRECRRPALPVVPVCACCPAGAADPVAEAFCDSGRFASKRRTRRRGVAICRRGGEKMDLFHPESLHDGN
jgi:hypothetical protein